METIAGRYVIVREIAQRLDITYEAVDEALGRRVILKELRVQKGASEAQVQGARRRFANQAITGSAMCHPNAVRTYDLLEESGRAFIVLEHVGGTTLSEVLKTKGPVPLAQALDITCQVLDALDAAGERGIVHRDLKPSNVMLTPDGTAKILDWGIAVREGEPPGERAGSPRYMAPEQLRWRPLDRRTDIFAAAVLFYELALGTQPFAADTVREVLQRIEYEEPAMPREWPPALCAILRRALSKDPERRYPRARDMLSDLMGLRLQVPDERAERPMVAPYQASLERQVRNADRLGLWMLAASGTILLVIGAIGLALHS